MDFIGNRVSLGTQTWSLIEVLCRLTEGSHLGVKEGAVGQLRWKNKVTWYLGELSSVCEFPHYAVRVNVYHWRTALMQKDQLWGMHVCLCLLWACLKTSFVWNKDAHCWRNISMIKSVWACLAAHVKHYSKISKDAKWQSAHSWVCDCLW